MIPRITDEMRAELERQQGGPILVEDHRTQKTYVLTEGPVPAVVDEELRKILQVGLDQSDRGESVPWEGVEEFLKKCHDRKAKRST